MKTSNTSTTQLERRRLYLERVAQLQKLKMSHDAACRAVSQEMAVDTPSSPPPAAFTNDGPMDEPGAAGKRQLALMKAVQQTIKDLNLDSKRDYDRAFSITARAHPELFTGPHPQLTKPPMRYGPEFAPMGSRHPYSSWAGLKGPPSPPPPGLFEPPWVKFARP